MRRAGWVAALEIGVVVLAACASGKGKATSVAVVRSQDAVRGCEFVSRLSSTSPQEDAYSEAALRQRVIDAGGDTLLLLGVGAAEAWKCGNGSMRAFADNPSDRRRTPTVISRAPTPWTTPRYGG
jgi:hypothetical protein